MSDRVPYVFLSTSMILVAAATTGGADARWNRVKPEGAGFSIEVPGERQPGKDPGQYEYSSGLWFFAVGTQPVDPATRILVERRDRKALKTRLESMRDTIIATVNSSRGRSSAGEIHGYPSLRFSLQIEELEGTTMLVLAGEQLYQLMTLGPKGTSDADAKRFLDSFRLTTSAAVEDYH